MNHSTLPPTSVQQVLAQGRQRRRWPWLVLLVFILLLGWLFFGRGEQRVNIQYVTAEASQGDLTILVTATGRLQPLNKVDVGSEVSGRVDAVLVGNNDSVRQGQVLARLNTDEQKAKVLQMRAALEVAEAKVLQVQATLQESELKLQRCQSLAPQGFCSPQELETLQAVHARASADLASARAQVSQAKATLDLEQTRLAKAEIRSPIDGIVLKRQVEPGQTVAASLQAPVLFTLAENLRQMELRVAVDEADIGKVQIGQQAVFNVDAYGERQFAARIEQVYLAPMAEGGVVSYETVLSLNNDALLLRPGMTATARITVQQIARRCWCPMRRCALNRRDSKPRKAAASWKNYFHAGAIASDLMRLRPNRIRCGRCSRASRWRWRSASVPVMAAAVRF
ncbi:MAG: efflux RND transporter periplasmic adaptor subunit [Gammaproteobacteria bacterium]|nr:efflux RND transporter periplasmic adaptor subunit [Gammaproteobacteria bacterium]